VPELLQLDDWVLCRLYNKKNNWEKLHGNTSHVSTEASHDTTMTPESDIEHEHEHEHELHSEFDLLDQFINHTQSLNQPAKLSRPSEDVSSYIQAPAPVQKQEESDWMWGLNLEEIQSSLLQFDGSNQDLFF
jgi:hypothetical protein